MKLQGSHEIFCIAHDKASSDLTEIRAEFERLRLRKEQLERLVAVLKPILGEEDKQEMVSAKETVDHQEEAPALVAEAERTATWRWSRSISTAD